MATNIGRSFAELDNKIKGFNNSIKDADKQVRQLDKDLKINPGKVDAVRQKYTLLSQKLQTNTQKIVALKTKQDELNKSFKNGDISASEYNRLLAKVKEQIDKTEKEVEELTKALNQQNEAMSQAKFSKFNAGMEKAEGIASKFSKTSLVLVGTLTALIKSAIDTGDALADTATKYQTNVESLQIWSNRLTMLASDSEAYTSSLAKVGSVMTSITAGRGARYLTYLKQLGITQNDLKGKTNAEAFDLIYNGLRKVTDEAQRSIIAQGLLGDVGLDIATVAGTAQEAINKYDDALLASGIITTEQAQAADEAANKWASVQNQFRATNAELLVSLMPAFQSFTDILKTTVIPLFENVTSWFGNMSEGGQRFAMALLLFVIILPKIISLVKLLATGINFVKMATHAQTVAQMGLNAASTPWIGIIMAISVALMILISLIAVFSKTARNAIDTSDELLAKMDDLELKADELGYSTEYNVEQTNKSENHRTVDLNLNVQATGDGTEMSQENADTIADTLHDKIMTDLLNNELGGIVR